MARSEEELDKKLSDLEFKLQHETMTLNDEKNIMKEMKKLEGQRERVREIETLSASVSSTMVRACPATLLDCSSLKNV